MTNEQRAHDLALVTILKEDLSNKNVYKEYIEIYNLLLDEFSKSFQND